MKKFMASALMLFLCLPVSLKAQATAIPSDQLILPPPVVKKVIPATLIAGTFRIDVEEYDQPSKSIDPKFPSGIGRVKFTCPPYLPPFPWKDIHPVLKSFSVVQSVTDSLTQIHISDALLVNPSVRVGEKIQLSLPQRSEVSETLVDKNLLIGLLKGLHGPEGIRVRFRDVEWTGGLAPVVVLSEGVAWYPIRSSLRRQKLPSGARSSSLRVSSARLPAPDRR